jgi:hypothetical protein
MRHGKSDVRKENKKRVIKVEQLKDKLFGVLAGSIEALDFEKWLYEQQELMDIIESNDFVYQVVCLDYRHKTIINFIDEVCNNIGDEEAYLVSKMERCCREILKTKEPGEILDRIALIGDFYDYETEYHLLQEFYHFEAELITNRSYRSYSKNEILVNNYKGYSKNEILANSSKLATSILIKLDKLPLNEKIQVLYGKLKREIEPPLKLASKTKWHDFFIMRK